MPIAAQCPVCFQSYDVPDRFAGKNVRCKSCGSAVPVPYSNDFDEPSTSLPPQIPKKRVAASSAHGTVSNKAIWLPVIIAGAAIFLFSMVALFLPGRFAIGIGMLLVGLLIKLASRIVLLTKAFQDEVTEGLLVLLIPIYPLIYMQSRWPKTVLPAQLSVIAIMLIGMSIPTFLGAKDAPKRSRPVVARPSSLPPRQNFEIPRGRAANPDLPKFAPPPLSSPEITAAPEPGNGLRGGPRIKFRSPSVASTPPPPAHRIEIPPLPHAPADPSERTPTPQARSAPASEMTLYLVKANGLFDRNEDTSVELESDFQKLQGYVPGSLKIDYDAGTVAFEASQNPGTQQFATHYLFRSGLEAATTEPSEPWRNPLRPHLVNYTIEDEFFSRSRRADPREIIEENLRKNDDYVPGSLTLDLEAKVATFEAYPGSFADRSAASAFARAGLRVRRTP